METRDNFNLRWYGFEANIKAAFRDVRDEREFSDVTLVAGDGKQAKANKVILASGSSFFFNVIRENPHPHPLIYLKGVSHNQLLSLLDFLYTGEASIAEEDLNTFLDIAEDFKVKGLTPTGSQMNSSPSISAQLQSQVSATEHVAKPGIYPLDDTSSSLQPIQESALQGEAATNELVPSPKSLRPANITSSVHDNVFPKTICKENHVSTNIVKVEVGDDSGSNFKNSLINEDLYEQSEECQNEGISLSEKEDKNDDVFSTGKKPKQEIIDSSTDMVISEVVDNEQLNYDWYEPGVENNRRMQAEQEKDDCFEVDKVDNFDGKQEIVDTNCGMDATESVDNDQSTHAYDECKKFSQPNKLKTYQKINTGEKRYECEVCFKRFSQRSHLKTHERTHTGEKPFQCSICFKRFSQTGALKCHKVIHTGEKPYQCEVCFRTFSQLRTLQDHKATHSQNPYSCLQCPKKFSRTNHLESHIRVHTGEKPYQCGICFKMFSQRDNLKSHERTHTREKRDR